MARKKQSEDTVTLIATNRTQGAAHGATARPLVADVDKWLSLGWVRATQPDIGASED